MANQQGNFGFRPVLMMGSAYNGQGQQQMTIASNETNSIFMGDPVVLNANGSISRGSSAVLSLLVFLMVVSIQTQHHKNQHFQTTTQVRL